MTKNIKHGVVHKTPKDLKESIFSNNALEKWNNLTPLARNEWICWIESAKKDDTRHRRIQIAQSKLLDGDKRPCCWPGCPHRKEQQ